MNIEDLALMVEKSKSWPFSEHDKITKNPLWIDICQKFNGFDGYYQRACRPCGNSRGIECAAHDIFSACCDNIDNAIKLIPEGVRINMGTWPNPELHWSCGLNDELNDNITYGESPALPKAILAALIRMKG